MLWVSPRRPWHVDAKAPDTLAGWALPAGRLDEACILLWR